MRRIAPIVAAVLATSLSGPASAYERPGRTELISVTLGGTPSNDFNVYPSISDDGRFVAWVSASPDLVPADDNITEDAFLRDRRTGRTEIVSLSHDGTLNRGGSKRAIVNGDGRFVAFNSASDDLVPGDSNGTIDIFVRDRQEATTERVSVANDGSQANDFIGMHDMDSSGRYVVFESPATNLVPGDTNGQADIFVRDRLARTTTRVSVPGSGGQANHRSHSPSISRNGRFVVFPSYASNLVPGDTNGFQDLFIHDRQTGATERASIAHDGAQPNEYSSFGVTDDAGRFVVYGSWASNLVPSDTGGNYDLFVRDRARGTTERVSVSSEGAQANGGSDEPSISADGRFVSFVTSATNLVPGDTNGKADAFVRDLVTGATERVNVPDEGGQADRSVGWRPVISGDGAHVVFADDEPSLGIGEVHVRSRGPRVGIGDLGIRSRGKEPGLEVTGFATFSGGPLTEASDAPGDATTALGDVGADLTRASVAYQAEHEQLLVRWDLATLASSAAGPGTPGVVYVLAFDVDGTRYEVRATRVGATVPPAAPSFSLYRCTVVCERTWNLPGSLGTAARGVMATVPTSAIGAADGAPISAIRAYTGFGEASGSVSQIDEVTMPSTTMPARTVRLGRSPADASEAEVAFDIPVEAGGGWFEHILEGPVGPGAERLWARACLGADCSARSVPLEA